MQGRQTAKVSRRSVDGCGTLLFARQSGSIVGERADGGFANVEMASENVVVADGASLLKIRVSDVTGRVVHGNEAGNQCGSKRETPK
jgi:hypothetical protein